MTLSFDYILQSEDKRQMKTLLSYIRDNGYVIQYKTIQQPRTKSMAAYFTKDDINDEAILTLLYFVDKYLKDNGQPGFVKDLDRLLFQWTDYDILWEKEQVIDALVGTEAFVKGLYWVLYRGQIINIGDIMVDCYSGDPASNIVGIDGQTFNGLVSGTIAKGKFSLPTVGNNKAGIVDNSNEIYRSLAQTLMRFRNKDVHYTDVDGDNHVEDDQYFKNTDNESKSFFIRMDIIIFLMLAIQYQYDNLCNKIHCLIPRLSHIISNDIQYDAIQLINERYLPGLIARQEEIIDEAFNFFSGQKDGLIHQDSINVMMRPINLMPDTNPDFYEDEDGDVNFADEQQEDPINLLNNQETSNVFLGGSSGSGKSTIVSKLIRELCRRWIADTQDQAILPIRINIRHYDISRGAIDNLIVKVISYNMNDSYLVKADEDCLGRYLQHLREQGRLMIFFDGLNEAGYKAGDVINEIIRYCKSNELINCRCIVTSRIVELGEKHLGLFKDFTAYELCPLSSHLMKEQVRRASLLFPSCNIWERISQSSKLQDIASNPQQLKLLIELLGRSEEKCMVPNKTLLFEMVVEKLMEQKYGIEAPDRQSAFNHVICCAAGLMMEQIEHIDIEWLKDYCYKQFNSTPQNIYELMRCAKEFGIIDSIHPYVSFKHDSWKEFYQAVYVKNMWLITDERTRRTQVASLRTMLMNDNEKQYMLATGLVCSIYELLDWDMANRQRTRERALLNDFTFYILTPTTNENKDVILEKDDFGGVRLLLNDGLFPQPDNVLKVLAMAISGMGYSPLERNEEESHSTFPSDPKTVVERLIINQLLLYRGTYPNSFVDTNLKLLIDLFSISALSGSDKILDELFHPYWLRMWVLQNKDFDKLMGIPFRPNEDWQQRSYEDRVALPNESRVLACRLIADAANKPALAQRLMLLYHVLSRCGYTESAAIVENEIISLFMRMTNHDLKKTIAYCHNTKANEIFRTYAALLLDDANSIKALFTPNKYEVPRIILNQLIQRMNEDGIADLLWNTPYLLKTKTLKALAKNNFAPLLVACHNGKLSNHDLKCIAEDIPLEMLPEDFVESHYDTSVFRHWPPEANSKELYLGNVFSQINWNEPSRYHSSVCGILLHDLRRNPSLATEKVWHFYMNHNKASIYTAFYAGLHLDVRKQAWCPTPDVCHVLFVSRTSILLFSPMRGYACDDLRSGLLRLANIGQKVSLGDLVIMEQDKTLVPLPSLDNELFYNFKVGYVKGKTGRDFFIGIPEMKDDFYFPDKNAQYDEMSKGEKVVFFPSVNLQNNGIVKPMAYCLKVYREQERSGVIEQKNLEMVSDREAFVLKIRDNQNNTIVTATLYKEYLTTASQNYIESLRAGCNVKFRNYAFGKKRCNIIIPNN